MPDLTSAQQSFLAVAPKISATCSVLGSFWILIEVWICSNKRYFVYHKLVSGMALYSVIVSAGFFTSNWSLNHSEVCSMQGFLVQLQLAPNLYFAMLGMYYMLVMSYSVSEELIVSRRWELWFHVLPGIFSFGTAIAALPLDLYDLPSEDSAWCWITNQHNEEPQLTPSGDDCSLYLLESESDDGFANMTLSCNDGNGGKIYSGIWSNGAIAAYQWACFLGPSWCSFLFLCLSLVSVSHAVRVQEQQMMKYLLRAQQNQNSEYSFSRDESTFDDLDDSNHSKINYVLDTTTTSLSNSSSRTRTSLSNRTKKFSVTIRRRMAQLAEFWEHMPRTRQVVSQACCYVAACAVSTVLSTVILEWPWGDVPFTIRVFEVTLQPLQGCLIFLAYRRPSYLRLRRKGLSVLQALVQSTQFDFGAFDASRKRRRLSDSSSHHRSAPQGRTRRQLKREMTIQIPSGHDTRKGGWKTGKSERRRRRNRVAKEDVKKTEKAGKAPRRNSDPEADKLKQASLRPTLRHLKFSTDEEDGHNKNNNGGMNYNSTIIQGLSASSPSGLDIFEEETRSKRRHSAPITVLPSVAELELSDEDDDVDDEVDFYDGKLEGTRKGSTTLVDNIDVVSTSTRNASLRHSGKDSLSTISSLRSSITSTKGTGSLTVPDFQRENSMSLDDLIMGDVSDGDDEKSALDSDSATEKFADDVRNAPSPTSHQHRKKVEANKDTNTASPKEENSFLENSERRRHHDELRTRVAAYRRNQQRDKQKEKKRDFHAIQQQSQRFFDLVCMDVIPEADGMAKDQWRNMVDEVKVAAKKRPTNRFGGKTTTTTATATSPSKRSSAHNRHRHHHHHHHRGSASTPDIGYWHNEQQQQQQQQQQASSSPSAQPQHLLGRLATNPLIQRSQRSLRTLTSALSVPNMMASSPAENKSERVSTVGGLGGEDRPTSLTSVERATTNGYFDQNIDGKKPDSRFWAKMELEQKRKDMLKAISIKRISSRNVKKDEVDEQQQQSSLPSHISTASSNNNGNKSADIARKELEKRRKEMLSSIMKNHRSSHDIETGGGAGVSSEVPTNHSGGNDSVTQQPSPSSGRFWSMLEKQGLELNRAISLRSRFSDRNLALIPEVENEESFGPSRRRHGVDNGVAGGGGGSEMFLAEPSNEISLMSFDSKKTVQRSNLQRDVLMGRFASTSRLDETQMVTTPSMSATSPPPPPTEQHIPVHDLEDAMVAGTFSDGEITMNSDVLQPSCRDGEMSESISDSGRRMMTDDEESIGGSSAHLQRRDSPVGNNSQGSSHTTSEQLWLENVNNRTNDLVVDLKETNDIVTDKTSLPVQDEINV